jgi:hypothetical protein
MQSLTSSLINSRIIQKKLVYIIGLSSNLIKIDEQKLKSYEYFGQYGKITKFSINRNKAYNSNGSSGPCYTCFITYSSEEESSLAILSMDNFVVDNHVIKANYGTTSYCKNYINNLRCKTKDCKFLHHIANEKDILSKEQMNSDKGIFPQQRLMAIELSLIMTDKKFQELYKLKDDKTIFPNGFSVYTKDIVINYLKEKNSGILLQLKYLNSIHEEEKKGSNKLLTDTDNKIIKEKKKNSDCVKKKELNELMQKNIINTNRLKEMYRSREKSRFDFVKPESNNQDIKSIIPSQLNDFLTQQFMRHSTMFHEEQNMLNDYYFSLKQNSFDSDDSWSSLIATLKKWNNIYETNDINIYNTN